MRILTDPDDWDRWSNGRQRSIPFVDESFNSLIRAGWPFGGEPVLWKVDQVCDGGRVLRETIRVEPFPDILVYEHSPGTSFYIGTSAVDIATELGMLDFKKRAINLSGLLHYNMSWPGEQPPDFSYGAATRVRNRVTGEICEYPETEKFLRYLARKFKPKPGDGAGRTEL